MTKISMYDILKKDYKPTHRNYIDDWASEDLPSYISLRRFSDTKWMMTNLDHEWQETRLAFLEVSNLVIHTKGIVLEVAAGPAGGFAPAYLVNNPDLNMIISDISPTICAEWSKVLHDSIYINTLSVAVNVCDMPFLDNSIDVVSSRYGMINIERGSGTYDEAISETYRVLKKEGLLMLFESFVTSDSIIKLSNAQKHTLQDRFPILFDDIIGKCSNRGFDIMNSKVFRAWNNKDDSSSLADLCRKLGIELEFEERLVVLRKQ
jgi:ubiquinone/menaquinone biosynthesis C-methylase UbiE